MYLELITPEKIYFQGECEKVSLPSVMGRFTVLPNHAATIALLTVGSVVYTVNGKDEKLDIASGLAEVKKDKIVVCIDQLAYEYEEYYEEIKDEDA